MNVGDYLRCSIESGAAIVPDIVTEIRRTRQNFLLDVKCDLEHDRIELYNHCYIVNSLKHPDEVNVLRRIYGDKFLLVSVVSSQRSRFDQLVAKIAKSHETTDESKFRDKADHLINKDRQRIDKKYGQNIGETYPLADVFIRGEQDLEGDLKRFLHILFGDQRETPTRLEYAMYEARANSLRSADLSRQVGAVITSQDFEIISRGCNEVPSAGGDTFWSDDRGIIEDNRDIAKGKGYNAVKKVELLKEFLEFVDKEGLIKFGNKNVDQTVDSLIYDELRDSFKHLRISNLIEFGRMVHAEMAALMEAARRGLAVNRGKLVCTTFPCHMCARHIISAGIREVYYIEPYPKSLVAEMYRDEIEIDSGGTVTVGNETKISKVYFHSFFGVAPRFFSRCFTMRSRKDTRGYTLPFVEQLAIPPMIPLARSHLAPELVVAQTMEFVPKVSDFAKVAPNA